MSVWATGRGSNDCDHVADRSDAEDDSKWKCVAKNVAGLVLSLIGLLMLGTCICGIFLMIGASGKEYVNPILVEILNPVTVPVAIGAGPLGILLIVSGNQLLTEKDEDEFT